MLKEAKGQPTTVINAKAFNGCVCASFWHFMTVVITKVPEGHEFKVVS